MKARGFAIVLAVLLAEWCGAGRTMAQLIGFSVSNSPSPADITQPLNYTIFLTNTTAGGFTAVTVTNDFSPPVPIISATTSVGSVVTNANSVVFNLGIMGPTSSAQMNISVQPTAPGFLTNRITVALFGVTNFVFTNITAVGGGPGGNSDIGVSITGPSGGVLVGDQFNLGLTVANFGTNTVPGVVLSNALPPGIVFQGVTPSVPFTLTSNFVTFNLGTFNGSSVTGVTLKLQATNATNYALTATVGAPGLADINPGNNTATTNITVGSPVLGVLVASNISAMTYNPQTGLMQQTVGIANVGTNPVSAARLIVSNLTHTLYNAVGTNSGSPFVVYNNTIGPGSNASVVLEYFVPTRLPFNVPNSNYVALGVSPVNVTPPAGTPFSITRMTNLASGDILIEFQSIPGKTYTIIYADNAAFTNSRAAQPSIVAPADRVQWIDTGPPKTISAPSNAPSRYYKVLQIN